MEAAVIAADAAVRRGLGSGRGLGLEVAAGFMREAASFASRAAVRGPLRGDMGSQVAAGLVRQTARCAPRAAVVACGSGGCGVEGECGPDNAEDHSHHGRMENTHFGLLVIVLNERRVCMPALRPVQGRWRGRTDGDAGR